MMGLLLLLLLGDATDAEFLAARAREIEQRYDQLSSRQAPAAIHERATLVRELSHLPFEDEPRDFAGRLLARIVTEDRAYRVRAEAARAIGRLGTPVALGAMVRALFGPLGREARFDLLYTVLPDAIENLRRPDDLDWVARRILVPAAGTEDRGLLAEAGPLERELLVLTLRGIGRGRAAALGPAVAPLARADDPEVRAAAVAALASLGIADPALHDAFGDPDERVRAAAAGSSTLEHERAAVALRDPSRLVRAAAIRGLSARSGREPISILVGGLADEADIRLRLDIADALFGLTGKDFGLDPDLWLGWWAAAREGWNGPAAKEPGERAYFFDLGLRTARVTFAIDVSASMATVDDAGVPRVGYAAKELQRAVRTLAPGARFRVLAYSGDVRAWPAVTEPPGDRTQAEPAVQALLAQKPGGPTNTYGALMIALEDPFAPDAIVLLTDGTPYRCSHQGKTYSEPEQILAEVRRRNEWRSVRIHAVALRTGPDDDPADSGAATDFLRRLAEANRGEFREIR
jgi:hypothetical protein